jgi:hypothetical protein
MVFCAKEEETRPVMRTKAMKQLRESGDTERSFQSRDKKCGDGSNRSTKAFCSEIRPESIIRWFCAGRELLNIRNRSQRNTGAVPEAG